MRKFALLKLKHNANLVIVDVDAIDLAQAVARFRTISKDTIPLDADGYYKNGDITFCVAEYFHP